jgi:4-amino-4-deoxy-L-arabinose transferase-like glycosyltransferase
VNNERTVVSTSPLTLPFRLPRARARVAGRAIALRSELLALLALAAVLDLWALDRNRMANDYYSAAVRSMTQSWHAFLYGSFDPSGVMTVDKPPLALWVQALSARAFGFSSWSILVPQALMGVATVALTYDLVRRRFGRAGGFAAGLVLALTPITVAISRHNNPDALLVLCCTAAVWFAVRALEDGRTRRLVLAGVMVGLGFETKMAAALLVVPALAAAYLWVAPKGRWRAVRQLAPGGGALAAVGLAWPLVMWLTPAADRPWVAGTSDNSIWSLILGYDGLGRLFGQDGGPGGAMGGPAGAGGRAGLGGVFGGQPGVLRLLNQALGGQDGWLLGLALVAAALVLASARLRRADPRTGWLIAVGGSFLVIAVAFSKAEGIFHPYYVSQLAPFTAALVGAGAVEMVGAGRTTRVLAPLAVAAGVAAQILILEENPGRLTWLAPLLVAAGVLGAAAVAAGLSRRLRAAAVAATLAVLLLAPASSAVQTPGHATSGTFPAGGPASAATFGGPGGVRGGPPARLPAGGGGAMFGGDSAALAQAVAYARAHGGGTIVVSSQTAAAAELIASDADVAGVGGFSGRESQVSLDWLADAVASGRIRWVVTDGGGFGPQDGRVGARAVMAAVRQVGAPVGSVSGLYDLQGKAGALRALAS